MKVSILAASFAVATLAAPAIPHSSQHDAATYRVNDLTRRMDNSQAHDVKTGQLNIVTGLLGSLGLNHLLGSFSLSGLHQNTEITIDEQTEIEPLSPDINILSVPSVDPL
jgi:hypothetical protein